MADKFIDKVFKYGVRNPKCLAREMAELAPGLVAVYDVSNEYDTYFDSSRWEISRPEIWGDSVWVTKDPSMGVLQGIGCAPPIDSFEQALWFAGVNLRSDSVEMHEQPQKVNLDDILARHVESEPK